MNDVIQALVRFVIMRKKNEIDNTPPSFPPLPEAETRKGVFEKFKRSRRFLRLYRKVGDSVSKHSELF